MLRLAAPIVCPGLFYAVPAQDGTLSRIRVPGGMLSSPQARAIASLSTAFAKGEVQITNRANLQIRAVQTPLPAQVLEQLQALGLAAPISAVDHLRNIMASPTAGIDWSSAIDTRPIVQALDQFISSHPHLADLPPKFSIGLDGGEAVSIADRPNDIGFTAVTLNSEVYFRLKLNGGKGGASLDLGILLPPEQVLAIVTALTEIYLKHEHLIRDAATNKPPRLRQLLQHWGPDWFLVQIEHHLGVALRRSPLETRGNDRTASYEHLGRHPQQPIGCSYLGVVVPLGRLEAEQLQGLATLAERYGSGALRLTPWQNVLIPDVLNSQLDRLQAEIASLELSVSPTDPASAIVACAGSPGCSASATHTQADALRLIDDLVRRVELDRPLNIHLTGCPKSCAQPGPSDITLLGDPENSDRYHVYVGTGDASQPFGQEFSRSIPIAEVPGLIEPLLQIYQQRSTGESFGVFVDRQTKPFLSSTEQDS